MPQSDGEDWADLRERKETREPQPTGPAEFYETWRKGMVYHRVGGRIDFKPEEAFLFAEEYESARNALLIEALRRLYEVDTQWPERTCMKGQERALAQLDIAMTLAKRALGKRRG